MAACIWRSPLISALRTAALALLTLLTACGGGSDPAATTATAQDAGRAFALGVRGPRVTPPQPQLAVTVLSVTRISEVRVGRTVFDYTFRVELRNDGDAFNGVVAQLVQVGAGSTIVQGRVPVGDLAPAALASPSQTVTVRHDRAVPFDLTAWRWAFTGQAASPAIVPGGLVLGSLDEPVLQGSTLSRRIAVQPTDPRNSVTTLAVSNPTPGGAAPAISNEGVVSWTPGEADFATRALLLTAQFADGSELVEQLPVRVVRERTVAAIPVTGSGVYGDPLGRYVVEVLPSATPLPAGSTMTIRELYDVLGRYDEQIDTGQPGFALRVIRSPQQPADPSLQPPSRGMLTSVLGALTRGSTASVPATAGLPVEPENDPGNPSLPYGNFLVQGQVILEPSLEPGSTGARVFTTRTDVAKPSVGWFLYPRLPVAKVQSNCTTVTIAASALLCSALAGTPVILIHGYSDQFGDNTPLDRLGGGKDTWGGLAEELTRRGHPTFELRWNTNMRFEEAAGLLGGLVRAVAEGTGRKPFVFGHSFGGVVAHVMAAGQGVKWRPATREWIAMPSPTTRLEGIITLGSPLSGLGHELGSPFVVGRDDEDIFVLNHIASVVGCGQVTCVQSGMRPEASIYLRRLPDLIDLVGDLPGATGSGRLTAGETIARLKTAWDDPRSPLQVIGSRLYTLVGVRRVPKDFASFEAGEAYKLGDGLFSIAGQAVLPVDFMGIERFIWGAPGSYPLYSWLSSLPDLSPSLYAALDAVPAQGAEAWMVRARSNGRTYYLARRAAHSAHSAKATLVECRAGFNFDLKPYRMAYYEEDVITDLRGGCIAVTVKHPLRQVMDTHLKQTNPSLADPPAVRLTLSGQVRLANGQPANAVFMNRTVVDRDGRQVGGANWTRVFDGAYSFDAAQLIRLAVGGEVADYSAYQVRIEIGDGVVFLPEVLTAGAWGNASQSIQLPTLTLRPVGVNHVAFSGTVREAGGTPVPQAVVRLARGVNLTYAEVAALPNSSTAQRVTANAAGQFTVSGPGLLPGEYTAWVSSPDHLTRGFARVVVAQGASLTLDGLELLPEGFTVVRDWTSVGPRQPNADRIAQIAIPLRSGIFGVAWIEKPRPLDYYRVFARFFDTSGIPVSPIYDLQGPEGIAFPDTPKFVPLPNGGAVLAWTSAEQAGSSFAFRTEIQRFDASGSLRGERLIFPFRHLQRVAALEDSSFGAFWTRFIYSPQRVEIFGRFFGPDGESIDGGKQIALGTLPTGHSLGELSVASDSSDAFWLSWSSHNSSSTATFNVQKVSRSGHVLNHVTYPLSTVLVDLSLRVGPMVFGSSGNVTTTWFSAAYSAFNATSGLMSSLQVITVDFQRDGNAASDPITIFSIEKTSSTGWLDFWESQTAFSEYEVGATAFPTRDPILIWEVTSHTENLPELNSIFGYPISLNNSHSNPLWNLELREEPTANANFFAGSARPETIWILTGSDSQAALRVLSASGARLSRRHLLGITNYADLNRPASLSSSLLLNKSIYTVQDSQTRDVLISVVRQR